MPKKSRRGNTARRFGFTWEREIVTDLKRIGWFEAVSARQESRSADALGKDICNTHPFVIQAKATNSAMPNYEVVFDHIKTEKTEYAVLAIKKRNKGKYAVLKWSDFLELVEKLKTEGIL